MGRILSALGLDRRAINNPNVSMNSQEFWDALGGGTTTAAGVNVTRDKAFGVSAWWRGIILRANAVAKIASPRVLRRQGAGFVVDATHPAHAALRRFRYATPFLFFQTLLGHRLTTGNGYAYIQRDTAGAPVELLLMDPSRVTPFRENGRLMYLYESDKGAVRLRDDEVYHSRGYGWDGLVGYSVVEKARESLGAAVAMREHGAKFFSNGARLGVLLEHPGKMTQEAQDRFLRAWRSAREGTTNAWKTIVLEEGMKASAPLQMSADDAQLIESRQFEVREIANFLGVPPHKLGDVATKTYASVEQEEQAFVNDTVDPDLVEMEQGLEAQLLTEEQKRSGDWIIRFDRSGLVRADTDARNAAHQTSLAGMPYRTINEVRADEGLNPLPGFDELHIPINLQQPDAPDPAHAGAAAEPPDEPAEPSDPSPDVAPAAEVDAAGARAAATVAFADARSRALRRLTAHARKAAKHPETFGDWLEGFRAEHEPVVREVLAPLVTLRASLRVDGARDLAAEVDALFDAVRVRADTVYSSAKPDGFAAAMDAAMAAMEDGK